MYEVVLSYRPDFSEKIVDRYHTLEEAQTVAERVSVEQHQRVIRVWVRQVRGVKAS